MRVRVRVRDLAEQQGLSAREMAEKANVPRRTIERLFATGDAESITVGTLARIAEALGVPTRALIIDAARGE